MNPLSSLQIYICFLIKVLSYLMLKLSRRFVHVFHLMLKDLSDGGLTQPSAKHISESNLTTRVTTQIQIGLAHEIYQPIKRRITNSGTIH